MATIRGWKDLGICDTCRQVIRETDSGNVVGHTSNCPKRGQAP